MSGDDFRFASLPDPSQSIENALSCGFIDVTSALLALGDEIAELRRTIVLLAGAR
jgi:hypothetical protein